MCYPLFASGRTFLKHLEFKTCGWQNDRHSEIFHCRVWARIKILVSSYKSYDHMSPLEGRVHHIDFMFIHLSCMHHNKKWVPSESTTPNFEWKTLEIKSVLAATSIFKKSWSLWTKLDSPLAYSSKYWEMTIRKFLPTDLSSLFKPQQQLNPKKLGANMVKSLNTIRRGIAPPLQNGAYSYSAKK
jgi:hypothetical protein